MDNLNNKVNTEQMPSKPNDVKPVNVPANGTNINPTPMNSSNNQPNQNTVNPNEVILDKPKQDETNSVVEVATLNSSVAPITEVNTNKKKSGNFLFFLVIIILLVITFYLDNVVDYLTEDNYKFLNGITNEASSGNLVNGFIKVSEETSFIKIEKIKFYNFKQTTKNTIAFDYVSSKNISNPQNLEIYIEIYNSNQELLYKELFNPNEKIETDVVSQYKMQVSDDAYSLVFYAKVKVYTKEEKASKQTLTCSHTVKNENIELIYKNTYNFINNELSSYDVSKSYTTNKESADKEKYKTEINNEYLNITKYKIVNNYKENLLTYSVDLNNYPEGFTPLYNKGTFMTAVKNKETIKKWTCK